MIVFNFFQLLGRSFERQPPKVSREIESKPTLGFSKEYVPKSLNSCRWMQVLYCWHRLWQKSGLRMILGKQNQDCNIDNRQNKTKTLQCWPDCLVFRQKQIYRQKLVDFTAGKRMTVIGPVTCLVHLQFLPTLPPCLLAWATSTLSWNFCSLFLTWWPPLLWMFCALLPLESMSTGYLCKMNSNNVLFALSLHLQAKETPPR